MFSTDGHNNENLSYVCMYSPESDNDVKNLLL